MRMDEDNGRYLGIEKERDRNIWQFSSNEFWKYIGSLVFSPTFYLGGSILWENQEAQKMSGNKIKRNSIMVKVSLYEFCVYPFLFNVFSVILRQY